MHTNFYFLRQLASALETSLTGLRFMECFSQDRDEVVLVFAQAKGRLNYYKPFYIKATLRPDFSGLSFPETVRRARTNSVDLFEAISKFSEDDSPNPAFEKEGRVVIGVRSFLNERCLAILLEDNYAMVFKFFGNRPNLVAFYHNTVVELFNQRLVADHQLIFDAFDRPIDQSWDAFEKADFDHRKLFPTFGKIVNDWLSTEFQKQKLQPEQQWILIQDVVKQLESPIYYVTKLQYRPTLSLLPVGDILQEFSDPIAATNRFYSLYNGVDTFDREKGEILRVLDKRKKRAESLIDVNMQRLIAREEGASHEEMGHILMANLHDIQAVPGAKSPESVTLTNFYRDEPITIKLKPDLSPQKNAENFYRKAKNEKIEEEFLAAQVASREKEIEQIDQQKTDLAAINTLKELRRYSKLHNLQNEDGRNKGEISQLFKEAIVDNFRILIGRNARNNDLLTQKYAFKEDLWLHARDVSGSHVIIKYQAGKPFPKNVIERAAELAAWYSKRRTDSLCPVIVTPKKYVRKPKGLAEGQVIVEKEDIVMVVPKE